MGTIQDALISCLQLLADVKYTQVSSLVILSWDYLNLLQDEIELFCAPRRWTIARLLFFVNRYWAIGYGIMNTYALFGTKNSDAFCNFWIKYAVEIGGLCGAAWAELILALRIYGLYGNRKIILIPLMTVWLLAKVASSTIASISLRDGGGTGHPFPGVDACAPTGKTQFVWAVWIPMIVYELIVFLLAVNITYRHLREFWTGSQIYEVIKIMQQDSTLYFTLILFGYTFSAMWLRYASIELVFVPVGLLNAVVSTLASRMLIHIKRQAKLKQEQYADSSIVIEVPRSSLEFTKVNTDSRMRNLMTSNTGRYPRICTR